MARPASPTRPSRARAPLLLAGGVALALLTSSLGPGLRPLGAQEPGEEAVLGFLAPRRGEVIADLGCGRGTWTFPLARAVGPSGRVYAVDIDPEAVAAVRARAEAEGVTNVEIVHSVPDDPRLPEATLDAIFLNNVIDWVDRPDLAGFLAGVRAALKADGRLVIRDPSGGADRVIAELYRAGFTLLEAQIPLVAAAPGRSFSTGWYALKLRPGDVQPSIFPRLGRPARYRVRLHLAEELFRMGLLTREELRATWEAFRDRPGPFSPERDEALDLVRAAEALDVVSPELARRMRDAVARGR